jgi:hypothetical protein
MKIWTTQIKKTLLGGEIYKNEKKIETTRKAKVSIEKKGKCANSFYEY